ncbi:MarR family winged helix-turn-helix transcriptional regulator [Microbacterium amylolyticum]|uniref:DNA-binding MarR family transcriptional regulator n=1 Tax=Microbacterium amylolyticum TaxID=936337 RepID=A0ABS4ZIQ0_9MICO|nr:MarR family transcriptional regulator [Microbacterium amylolyticum]MBP2437159.1 DNA-binding MarR family transcriptional regulator [Microbacterium amylolyticum]
MTSDTSDADAAFLTAVKSVEAGLGDVFAQFRRVLAENADRLHAGMLPGTYKLFSVIARRAPITAKELAASLSIDKGQVSRMVRELEDLALVARSPDPNDGRSSVIEPTENGRQRLEAARGAQEHTLTTIMREWSIDDIERLGDLLHRLTARIPPAEKSDA